MRKVIKVLLVFIFLFLINIFVLADEEEISLADISIPPTFYIISPSIDTSYSGGGTLKVETKGQNVESYDIILSWENNKISESFDGTDCNISLKFEPSYHPMELRVIAYSQKDKTGELLEQKRLIPSPKQEIINRMIALAFTNFKDKNYYFAPAEEDHHIGVCKNFVMRLFDTFSKEYRMHEFPNLALHMPKNNSLLACKPYQYGIEWRIESAEDGSPFEIAAQFKYNNDISEKENYKLAFELMTKIQKGDFFQMVGNYGGGNGPHSLYFIQDYDALKDLLHWTDSNMFGKRVEGVRWGYMQFDAIKSGEWFANCFNMKNRGATIYRLRDDLIKP